jgi:hypothetical protein
MTPGEDKKRMRPLHATRRPVLLVVLFSLLISTADGCAFMNVQRKRDPNEPHSVTWDFRQNNHLANLDAYTLSEFARLKTSATAYEDGIHLTLHLPGNRTFDEDLNAVICWRNGSSGDRVRDITAYFPHMDIEEIERTGNRLIEYWKFDRKNFNEWCRVRYGAIPEEDERLSFSNRFYSSPHSEKSPSFSLKIIHTRGASKPWHIIWEASWNDRDVSVP